MVRSYKRTTHRSEYSHETLIECLNAVRNKTMSLREASRSFSIPRSTIQKRLKSRNPDGVKRLGPIGRVFSDEMEIQLKSRVLEMESTFYGISMMDLRRAAYDFAEGNDINHRFNRHSRLAGKDWALDFNRRHHISVRTPQSNSMNRVLAFDREKVSRFFELLKLVFDREKIPPHRVYNLDETGITSVPKPGKILALTGRKQVGRIASGEKGRTVTVVAAISATGQFIPPCMIFPRKRMSDRLLTDAVPGTVGYVSGNGWIDSSLFVTYLDHFIEYTHASTENKVLLIVDNHISHKSIEAIDKAHDNGIVLLTLPPHTSSKLQPLDHSVFRSLKINYSQECDKWMTNNHGKKITEYDMSAILKPAFLKAMTPSNIISGFKSTGIYPYNPDVITDDDYTAADAARGLNRLTNDVSLNILPLQTNIRARAQPSASIVVPPPEDNNAQPSASIVVPPPEDNNAQPSASIVVPPPEDNNAQPSASIVVPPPEDNNAQPSASIVVPPPEDNNAQPSASIVVPPPEDNNAQPSASIVVPPPEDNNAQPSASIVVPPPEECSSSTSASTSFLSLDIISPVRKRVATKVIPGRRRTAEQADIITASPYKRILIEKKLTKENKVAAAELRKVEREQKKKDAEQKKKAAEQKKEGC